MSIESLGSAPAVVSPETENALPEQKKGREINISSIKSFEIPTIDIKIPQLKTQLVLPIPFGEGKFDLAIDRQIRDCFQSQEFVSKTFDYIYEGKIYAIRIIHNPQRAPLHGKGFSSVERWPIVMTSSASLPFWLENHLKKLAPSQDGYIEFSQFRKYGFETFADLQPVVMNIDGELDSQFDDKIKEAFQSKEMVNKVFYYRIQGQDYIVRVIHNPDKAPCKASMDINCLNYKDTLTLLWSRRYGILVDKKAPQELIDRLVKLAAPSWWDRMWSFKIFNGDPVSHEIVDSSGRSGTRTFEWISACEFYSNLSPSK